MDHDASIQPADGTGAGDSQPAVQLAPDAPTSAVRSFGAQAVALATFAIAIVGALALGLGITDYLGDHLEVLAYLAVYAGFRVALMVVTAHRGAVVDLLKACSPSTGDLLTLMVFAAAPFERTFFYASDDAPVWLAALGLLIGLLGFWIALVAQIQIDRAAAADQGAGADEPLVRTGLFRYVRHPSYAGQCLAWMGWPLIYGAPITAVAMLLGGAMLVRRQIRREEARMLNRFGEQYATYVGDSERLVPGVW